MLAIDGRIGALVHAVDIGLGILGRALFENGVINQVMLEAAQQRTVQNGWYPGAPMATAKEYETFLDDIDALLIVETVSDWSIVDLAQKRGIPVTLMPMYECTPSPLPVMPDRYLCPSLLDYDYYTGKGPALFLPVPVEVPWRKRHRARVFVHNAGTAKSAVRNGTRELLMAIALVQSEAKFLLRLQSHSTDSKKRFEFEQSFGELLEETTQNPSVEFINKTVNYDELWNEGDVFVFPEKYNGLSLPLQEARASGMLVMAGNRYPINTWLPTESLIPVDCYETRKLKVNVESAVYQPEVIANCIDEWFDSDISTYSEAGKSWARDHSWSKWRASYRDFILTGNLKPETDDVLL